MPTGLCRSSNKEGGFGTKIRVFFFSRTVTCWRKETVSIIIFPEEIFMAFLSLLYLQARQLYIVYMHV